MDRIRKLTFEHWLVAFFAIATVVLGLALSPAHGASGQASTPSTPPNQQGYRLDQQTTAFRSGLVSADSTNLSTVLSGTTEFVILGSRNIPVSARFSASGQTCKVRILYVYKPSTNIILGISEEITLTGTLLTDASGLFVAPTTVFDGMGASHVRIMLTTAPASGTVSLWAGSF
jgi:hypothetical protein